MKTDLYYMRLVAGTGQVEQLVTGRVSLPVPAEEILEWRKQVVVDRAEAVCGGVILTGVVRSRCLFTAPEAGGLTRVLSHVTEIWFNLHLPLPEANEGMPVTVTDAYVASESARAIGWSRDGAVSVLLDQSVVVVGARVLQPGFVPFPPKAAPKAPRPRRRPRKAKTKRPAPPPAAPPQEAPPPPEPAPAGTWIHPAAMVPGAAVGAKCKQDTAGV